MFLGLTQKGDEMKPKQRKALADAGLTQLELANMPPQRVSFDTRRYKLPWYYITRKNNQEMLMGFDENGQPQWFDHDLRVLKPHLYNNIKAAQIDMHKVGGHRIRSYPYSVR